jgi:hypothetical protein
MDTYLSICASLLPDFRMAQAEIGVKIQMFLATFGEVGVRP